MSDRLRTWLAEELDRLKWSHRELARQSGLSQSIVSKTISGERNASADFCVKVAQALGESPEKLLRLAGILPQLSADEEDQNLGEAIDIMKNMNPEQRKEALRYLRYLFRLGRGE